MFFDAKEWGPVSALILEPLLMEHLFSSIYSLDLVDLILYKTTRFWGHTKVRRGPGLLFMLSALRLGAPARWGFRQVPRPC